MQPAYASLSFPLNVYAHCLTLDLGSVAYLHYGLFEQADELADVAQQRSTELVLARQPAPPAEILEIGPGLGTTAAKLTQAGHRVMAITPDSAQIALARQRALQAVFHAVSFEDFLPNQQFDWILLQESAQYLDSLSLLQRARQWLKPQGQLLIVDEFAHTRREQDAPGGLPLLATLLAQAERCGMKLLEHLDLSVQAAPTVDYLLRQIRQDSASIIATLPVTAQMLDHLLAVLETYRQHYRNGDYGYHLLRFAPGPSGRWQGAIRSAQDTPAVRDLFAKVFSPETLSAELWRWKYGQGRGIGTVARHGETVVAHYGGIVRGIHFFGTPEPAVQIGDVMVDPQQRGILGRKGAFYHAAALFPERWVGYGAPYRIGFGFPNAHAMKVAERLGLYAQVGCIDEIRWASLDGRARLMSQVRPLHPGDALCINQLWHDMAVALREAIVCVRDWGYIQHRYCNHPHKRYEIYLVRQRFSGKPLGLIVLRQREDGAYWLLDYLGSLEHLALCIYHARRIAARSGHQELIAWITDNFTSLFAATGAKVSPSQVRIPTSIHTPGPPPETLRNRWWLMAGDTDFQ